MNRISLCVIAKDEAELLPRMLASVNGVVDEMVIVDTGSSDETIQIARRAGAKVLEHPFADDFSEVRNVSLAAATGDWILVLDADEVLAPGSGERIRRAVQDPRLGGFYLNFHNHLGEGRVHACGMMRLFRNHPDVRFRYFIHEQVLPDLVKHCRATSLRLGPLDDVIVDHDGYVPTMYAAREKDKRNERLFRRQVEAYPDHAYSWYKFGDFLRRFDDRHADARRALARAVDLVEDSTDADRRDYSFGPEVYALLALETEHDAETTDALAIAERGLARAGPAPNLLYVLAYLLGRADRPAEAFRVWAQLRTYEGKLLPIPPEPGVLGAKAFCGMGMSLARIGRSVAAARCLEHAIKRDPELVDARVARARIHLDAREVTDAIHQYRAALATDATRHDVSQRLAVALGHVNRYDEALLELEKARANGADEETLAPRIGELRFASGDLEGAFKAFLGAPGNSEACAGAEYLAAIAQGRPAPVDSPLTNRLLHHARQLGLPIPTTA